MGSTGRKRPADQMAADGSGPAEEPRSDRKNKSGRRKKDKKRGSKHEKGKKSSNKGSKSNKDGSSAGTSLETTATEEGQQMAQVLSTFSRLEQSRFEAFRKAAFPGDAISKYVAHCLIHNQHRPLSAGANHTRAHGGGVAACAINATVRTKIAGVDGRPTDRDGKAASRFRHLRPTAHQRRRPVLSELVAPGQAGDITVVVSTLAKKYAQRLVLAARRYNTERTERAKERKKNSGDTDEPFGNSADEDESEDEDIAISPEDILKAHADRQARGLDPGFFLQGSASKDARASETSLFLADPDNQQRYSQTLSVVLAAQEEFDKAQEENEEEDGEDVVDDSKNNDGDGDVTMAGTEESIEAKDTRESGGEEDIEEEEEEDTSEKAMKLFSLHVNRMVARQHGIALVTSEDEDSSSEKTDVPKTEEESGNDAKKNPNETQTGNSSSPTKSASGNVDDSTTPMDTSSDPAAEETPLPASTPPTPTAATNPSPNSQQQTSAESADGTAAVSATPEKDQEVITIDD